LYGPHRKPAAGFWLDASERLLQFVETVASTCQQFVYELETIGTSGRPKLFRAWSSRYARRLASPAGSVSRNNFENSEIALDNVGQIGYITPSSEEISKARAETSAAGFLFAGFPIGRRPDVKTPHRPRTLPAVGREPPSEFLSPPTNVGGH